MKKLCFVIMGYGKKTDPLTGKSLDLDKTYLNIIRPAVIKAGLECIRGDEIQESGLIDKSMYALLIHSDLVIADISTYNPNAVYELGVRHASRPFSTIILKEDQSSIPFDINHNKIFEYTHMGEDIGATEAQRCQKELIELINTIIDSEEVDSPFFQYISNLTPYKLSEKDYHSIIKELSDKEKHVFAVVERAKTEMNNDNFDEAVKLWSKANKMVENEIYFIQQLALATYKSKKPSERTSLQDALKIISSLEIDGKLPNDSETLGIAGAIYKRLWLLDNDVEYLNRAIDLYGKGFQINMDYYTGENYALCLVLKSVIDLPDDEKTYYIIEAKKTREKIIQLINEIFDEDDYKLRNDIKWIYATFANCLLATDKKEESKKYETLFYSCTSAKWEQETYEMSKQHIINLKK